jgi:colicin import membrane protein
MNDSTPYNMPKEPGRWRAIFLATLVHAALFGLLWFGIRWQSETPVAVEAEVWNMQAREEATPQPRPQPEPQPKPEEPRPVIKEAPKPPVAEQPVDTPDIVLEQEKKRIEEKRRLDEENRKEKERQEKQEKLAAAKKLAEAEELKEKQAEEKRIEKEKQEKLAAARKLAEAEELKKKQAAEKAATEKLRQEQIVAEQKAAEKRHQENLERMTAQAGGTGPGTAPRAQAGRGDPDYGSRVAAKIKSNTIFNIPDTVSGNPPVEYEVQLLPDGSLRSMRKVRSSGVPGFDEAVARAIERSSPFPPDKTGVVPTSFNVIHRPKDQ